MTKIKRSLIISPMISRQVDDVRKSPEIRTLVSITALNTLLSAVSVYFGVNIALRDGEIFTPAVNIFKDYFPTFLPGFTGQHLSQPGFYP
jgi:hypothetical protein